MTELAAGDMRYRVTIQRRENTKGSRGETRGQWCDYQNRWAKVEHLRGRELEQARQIVATATTRFTVRDPRLFEMDTKYRVRFRGKFYNVEAVTPSGEKLEDAQLLCGQIA
jgi:SPP1 family predicted phage head-tail adaptor